MNDLTIFHYHVMPGGVTSVISKSVRAIVEFLSEINSITIVCGRKNGTKELSDELTGFARVFGKKIAIDVLEEIDYLDADADPDTDAVKHTKKILLERYRNSNWWIHNYHIGKNPIFTESLLQIVREREDINMVFHIHDFPECSRYDNLRFLNRIISLSPYPIRPNVRYAVINGRDQKLLCEAGVPKELVFLLNDPVAEEEIDRSKSKQVKQKLRMAFGDDFPGFDPEHAIMLYPIRTIRRKNVLEAGLIATVSAAPVNLVVTLPGISIQEKPYSDAVEKAFKTGLINGLWGIGARLEQCDVTFAQIKASAALLCSSSIQEGFGYQYISADQWGVPMVARYLDILDGIKDVFDKKQTFFYTQFRVPSSRETQNEMRDLYEKKIGGLSEYLDPDTVNNLRQKITSMLKDRTIDFSFLDVHQQYDFLSQVRAHPSLRDEVRALNKDLFKTVASFLSEPSGFRSRNLDARFTFRGFAGDTQRILSSFAVPFSENPEIETEVQNRLLRSFASPDYIRLLYA